MELSSLKPHPKLVALLSQSVGGRHTVERMVAIGGMAAVFQGCQESIGRRVAIKVLLPELADKASYRERFETETSILARLDHPHCVRLLDAGETDDGLPYLVTEFVEGRELGELLRRPLEVERATRITAQLLDALEHTHAQGVVHRDLKPANVLVCTDRDGRDVAKIVDFGVAKDVRGAHGSEREPTEAGIVFGTPGYMSPEQAGGRPIDYRSDLYSVGVLLLAMLLGRSPFEGPDLDAIVLAQLRAELPPLPPTVPPSLGGVLRGLLAPDPNARYGSARVAAEALARALEAPSPSMPEPSLTATPSPSFGAAAPWRWVAAGVLTGVGLLALAFVASQGVETSEAEALVAATPPVGLDTIDAMIAREELQTAEALLDEKLGRDPDAALLWRKGRVVARQGKAEEALELYARALERKAGLRDDPEFFVEIRHLMEDPALERRAIEIATTQLGHLADDDLVARLNRTQAPLEYVLRHRVWDHVAEGELGEQVDEVLNIELDVRQAAFAPRPCVAYAAALAAIQEVPEQRLLDVLARTPPPQVTVAADEQVCARLPALRNETLASPPVANASERALRASLWRPPRRG